MMFLWVLKVGIFNSSAETIFLTSYRFICLWILLNVYIAIFVLKIGFYSETIIDLEVDFIMIIEYMQTINWALSSYVLLPLI